MTSKIHTDSNISNGDFSSYIEKNITEYHFSSQHWVPPLRKCFWNSIFTADVLISDNQITKKHHNISSTKMEHIEWLIVISLVLVMYLLSFKFPFFKFLKSLNIYFALTYIHYEYAFKTSNQDTNLNHNIYHFGEPQQY